MAALTANNLFDEARESMVGINVGATTITLTNGETIDLDLTGVPRDLLRRVADNTPYVSLTKDGVRLRAPHEMYARTVAAALHKHQLGSRSTEPVAVAVPGWWTPRTVGRVQRAFAEQDLHVALINEAEATVMEYRHSEKKLPQNVAVVSLSAEQVSVVIVRNCTASPSALTSPARVHAEGGTHLDALVMRHIVQGLTDLGDDLHPHDLGTVTAAQAGLRQCRTVREELSATVTESILPDLPGATHRIRMVRSELEELARPWADAVVTMVSTTIDQSALPIDAVIVTGGLAAMPLVSQRISADLRLEVHVPSEPALVAARGAEQILAIQQQPAPRQRFPLWRQMKKRGRNTTSSENVTTRQSNENPELDALISAIFGSHPEPTQRSPQVRSRAKVKTESLIGADDR